MLRNLVLALVMTSLSHVSSASIPKTELQRRWQSLADQLPDTAVLMLLPAESAIRSRDVKYPYRQDNDVIYYTVAT